MCQNLRDISRIPLGARNFYATTNLFDGWFHCPRTNRTDILWLVIVVINDSFRRVCWDTHRNSVQLFLSDFQKVVSLGGSFPSINKLGLPLFCAVNPQPYSDFRADDTSQGFLGVVHLGRLTRSYSKFHHVHLKRQVTILAMGWLLTQLISPILSW